MNLTGGTYTNATGLSDYPFKAQIDWVTGKITASQHANTIHVVWERVNSNYCGILECIRKEAVENTINAYMNLVMSDKNIPVYNWYYVEKDPREAYVSLVNSISNKTGVTKDEVRKILKQLEFSDKDGSIQKGYHNPRLLDKKVTKCPPGADCNKWGVEDYLKWGAIGVGSALLLTFGIKAMNVMDQRLFMAGDNPNVTWEEARLLVFESFKTIKEGIDEIKSAMHEEFKSFKNDFNKANDLKLKEMSNEITVLKKNQFDILQKSKKNEGQLQGKAAVYTVLGTSIALIISVLNLIKDLI